MTKELAGKPPGGAWRWGSTPQTQRALLDAAGDGPPGFELMKRRRGWASQNDVLLGLDETPLHRLYAGILTSLIGEGAREVAVAPARRQAEQIIDAVIEYARRLMSAGPWPPA